MAKLCQKLKWLLFFETRTSYGVYTPRAAGDVLSLVPTSPFITSLDRHKLQTPLALSYNFGTVYGQTSKRKTSTKLLPGTY